MRMSTVSQSRQWGRHVPPLVSGLLALAMALLLPSSLNVPITNPSQTLEFAPVPPQDDAPPPQQAGNVASLALGTSAGVAAGDAGAGGAVPDLDGVPPPPPELPPAGTSDGTGADPVSKRCVGNPPRQTEDPMSPPCVAHFEGDNGGATASGVTAGEVVVLVYVESLPFSVALACQDQGCDVNQFYDLGKNENESNEAGHDEQEAYWPHVWRVWQKYFNDRYQTYGRNVHLWVHYGRRENTPEARRADVAEAAAKVNPFAIIADVNANGEVYAGEWARRGRTVFMGKTSSFEEVGFNEQFFQKYPGQIWDYNASVQQMADNFGSFLCNQVVPHPVTFSGDETNGQPRKLGLLRNSDPTWQNRIEYAALIRKKLERCGADIAGEWIQDNDRGTYGSGTAADANASAAQMRQAGVTTIIYLAKGPSNPGYSHSVAAQVPRWRPEWIVQSDNTSALSAYEHPDVFQHARNFTLLPRVADGADRPCEHAYAEVEPNESVYYESWTVCVTFNNARMLFTGIQVAGPRLTVTSLDQGMHAIPAIPSGDPTVPACFYNPGDYTCVKDAHLQWWDPTDRHEDKPEASSCWKSMEDGKRYLPDDWPKRDVDAVRRPAEDSCNLNY
jgi:hypothetical protein